MKMREGLIEYIGIRDEKKLQIYFIHEVTVRYDISKLVDEIIKIQSEVKIVDFQKITFGKGFCTVKFINLIEYIDNKDLQAVSVKELISMITIITDTTESFNKENIKVIISNIKGKLCENNELLIYFKLRIGLE